jgi:indole-3-glycerol phosphate synthase
MTILEKIIENKKKELAVCQKLSGTRDLEKSRLFSAPANSLKRALCDQSKTGIIAEFKRMSPSKGVINRSADLAEVVKGYACHGAAGLSILTDAAFFGGSCEDLIAARDLVSVPLLRKDFIIDEYQVIEAKAAGADVILLIAAALEAKQASKLASLAHLLGMEVLFEVHSADELDLLNDHIDIIGVNKRDLMTFKINTDISIELVDKIPSQFLKISESGITSPAIARRLIQAGYNGFLIGELFMGSDDPVAAFSAFTKELTSLPC